MGIHGDKKRNISIIAHRGAGKTTLAEAILFNAKATDRLGRVDDENSVLDFEPEEQKRKMTLASSLHHYEWDKHAVNFMDTPGYTNFLGETRGSLTVTEGAVVVLSAISGVKVQTEKVWEFADEFGVKRLAFVNKMDRDRANFANAVEDMQKVLGTRGVPLQIPIGEGEGFKGVVDLLTMKACLYSDDPDGGHKSADIPDELKEQAQTAREQMIEAIVETDDVLMEKYLEGAEVTAEEILKGLRAGTMSGAFVPVLMGSAYKNMGVDLLMDAVNVCLPSPIDGDAVKAKDCKSGEEIGVERTEQGKLSAVVFKTIVDPYTGKLSVMRLFSGRMTKESVLHNYTRDIKEKVAHILVVEGKKTKEVTEASVGDIVALPKLKDTHAGDTLCEEGNAVEFEPLPHMHAALAFALMPKTKADEEKAPAGLSKLMEEDPALEFRRDEETKEFMLSGTGQVHLEVAVERLKRKYGCEVELKSPRVPYKETIRATVSVQGRYKKQSGGRGQFGDTWLEIGPLPKGKGFEFENAIVGGAIPRQYIPAVEKGIKEAMNCGMLAGYPVVDLRVKLYDGSFHSVDSSEMAFKIAASMGFKKGMEQAKSVLLEPIMSMEIAVPDENMGDVIGDANSRRGKIQGVDPKSGSQVIRALVPMSEVITYASDLNGMTADRGIFTMSFSHYEEVPDHISKKIIENAKKEA